MADYGFAVKRPDVNKDVTSCSVTELAASSKFNCFKIAYEGTAVVLSDPSDPLSSRTSVTHGLNFNPVTLAFAELSPGKYYNISLATTQSNYHRFVYWSEGGFTPGDRKIVLSAASSSSSSYGASAHNVNVKYFIFGDTSDLEGTTSTLTSSGDYGFKIMKPNYDGETDNYVEHIIWSSRTPPMKVAKVGSFSQTVGAGATVDGTVAHGLPYAPAFLVMRDTGTGHYYQQPYAISSPASSAENWVDGTNLHFGEINGSGSPVTVNYRYIIFAEKASTT